MSDLLTKKLHGLHLIDASAGTGKTYTITALVVRLLLEEKLGLSEILIVTYTEAAAQDLRKRVREVLVDMGHGYAQSQASDAFVQAMLDRDDLDPEECQKRLQLALHEFDEAAIFTIHGFCKRSLQENGLESGLSFGMELEKDMSGYRHQVASDYWRSVSVGLSANFLSFCGKKLQPEALVRCLGQLRPELAIIPEIQDGVELSSLEEKYQQGLQRLSGEWQICRDDLEQLLLNQSSLSLRQYKLENISGWFVEMDIFLAGENMSLAQPPKCFVNFTTSGLTKGLKQKCPAVEHPFFDLAERFWQDWQELKQGYDHKLLYLQRRFYSWAEEELARLKEQEQILFFDDLLTCLFQGLTGAGGDDLATQLRSQYPAILIDEFQDTDPVQFRIFKAIHANIPDHLLYLIGDPKQAIYNFRGADIFAYLQARDSVKSIQSLSHNYRSEEGLIHGVNHLFAGQNPFLLEAIEFEPVGCPGQQKNILNVRGDDSASIHILFGEREPLAEVKGKKPKAKEMTSPDSQLQAGRGCCAEITRLLALAQQGQATLGDQPVQPRDIAILVRENKQARDMQALLLDHGVASVIKDNENLFNSHEAGELYLILQGVASRGNQRLLTCGLATDCLGWSALDLHLLQHDDEGWDDIVSRFIQYHDVWQERGFMAMFRAFLASEEVRQRLLSRLGGERRLTNILHLAELLHHEWLRNPSMHALLDFLRIQMDEESKTDEFEQRLESDSQRLQILTIHKAKGLEFPIVFCPFLWKGLKAQKGDPLFHDGDDKKLTLDLGSDDLQAHKDQARFEDMAESLRLAYVALTRASNRCILNWGGYYSSATSPLAYLFHSVGDDFGVVAKRVKASFDDDLRQVVEDVAARSGSSIVVRENQTVIHTLTRGKSETDRILALSHFQADLDRSFQVTSFSRLTSGHKHESLVTDRDQDDGRDEMYGRAALNLFDFPRGAAPGTFLHYLFEYVDFGDLDSESSRLFVTEALARFGYEEKWLPVMVAMLDDVCHVQLPHQNFCLADVLPHERLNELEFYFPLAQVNSHDFAELFRNHGTVGGEAWYSQVAGYGFQLLKGFLKGFVDLVFKHDDRYFIIDWKSNYLGNHHGAYGQDAMEDSMVQSGYILQYHLYSLALHRYLGTRLDNYDYESHFGGVIYVYLRGVNKADNGTGLFWDRPTKALMGDLDELFTGSGEV